MGRGIWEIAGVARIERDASVGAGKNREQDVNLFPVVPCAQGCTQPLPFYCVFTRRERAERSREIDISIYLFYHFRLSSRRGIFETADTLRNATIFFAFHCWITPDLYPLQSGRAPLRCGRRPGDRPSDGMVLKV